VKLADTVDLDAVAARTPGFVGADLANLVNEAALLAARADKEVVEPSDLDEAVDRLVTGIERSSRVLSAREKGIIAYHEAGHALVAASRKHADPVAKVSIIPRGVAALGYTQQQPTEDRYLMTREEILARIDVLLGGRVAEEIAVGDVSTGAADDLRRATELARHMVTEFGMGDALGLVAYPDDPGPSLLDGPGAMGMPRYGADTARLVDEEVRRTLDRAHDRVTESLQRLRGPLEELARKLMEKEVVDGATVVGIIEDGPVLDIGDARDPVCGMRVPSPLPALSVHHRDRDYRFCSKGCLNAFIREPERFSERGGPGS
jgi:cell division protease FtsH